MRRAVVTRPEVEARRWVSALQDHGWQALSLPLIVIAPPADPRPLQQARARLADFDALMFVSAPAVEQFFAGRPWSAADSAGHSRCWAPGPATGRALLAAGVPPGRIDQPDAASDHFDSESLWREVGPQVGSGHRLRVVRGQSEAVVASPRGSGRDWLAQQCRARGGGVDWCVAYRRQAPDWGDEERAQAIAASRDGSVWLLSSTEALDHLAGLLPGVDWSQARAVASHPRIAQAAARMGFGIIVESRPTLQDLLLNLESLS